MDEVIDKALESGVETILCPQHGEPPVANELLKEEHRKPAHQ
jgi:ATP-dependent Lon protease